MARQSTFTHVKEGHYIAFIDNQEVDVIRTEFNRWEVITKDDDRRVLAVDSQRKKALAEACQIMNHAKDNRLGKSDILTSMIMDNGNKIGNVPKMKQIDYKKQPIKRILKMVENKGPKKEIEPVSQTDLDRIKKDYFIKHGGVLSGSFWFKRDQDGEVIDFKGPFKDDAKALEDIMIKEKLVGIEAHAS